MCIVLLPHETTTTIIACGVKSQTGMILTNLDLVRNPRSIHCSHLNLKSNTIRRTWPNCLLPDLDKGGESLEHLTNCSFHQDTRTLWAIPELSILQSIWLYLRHINNAYKDADSQSAFQSKDDEQTYKDYVHSAEIEMKVTQKERPEVFCRLLALKNNSEGNLPFKVKRCVNVCHRRTIRLNSFYQQSNLCLYVSFFCQYFCFALNFRHALIAHPGSGSRWLSSLLEFTNHFWVGSQLFWKRVKHPGILQGHHQSMDVLHLPHKGLLTYHGVF